MRRFNRQLTPTEQRVLDVLSTGAKNHEAAKQLGMSKRTVDFHRANIYKRLEVDNLIEACVKVGILKRAS